jgi:hypothetical protein
MPAAGVGVVLVECLPCEQRPGASVEPVAMLGAQLIGDMGQCGDGLGELRDLIDGDRATRLPGSVAA